MHSAKIQLEIKENIHVVNITSEIKKIIEESKIEHGLVNIYTQHTTTGIRINEDEPGLIEDFKSFMKKLVPNGGRYEHDDLTKREVPKDERINGHSHIQAFLLGASETIPIENNKLQLGPWQSIFFVDLDGENRKRTILINISD
ncbi:MAG: secondary thiamine-phosphate synthase enzyme [Nanoarchaeota archaeon]|nr:secondary thiamine-phosphate synthase enzyme [Nanoarchaeota archaeon]